MPKDKGNNRKPVVYCYEQVTPFYHTLKNTLKKINSAEVIGSEYLGLNIQSGEEINGIRHEDALALSFEDESLDYIVSNDVYEHVPDIRATFSEAYRTLKPQGVLLFTVPFWVNKDVTVKRAVLDGEEITYSLEPCYHGNPISSEKGSLVFYDFGWDLFNFMREAGFKRANLVLYYSARYGYLGSGVQTALMAVKE